MAKWLALTEIKIFIQKLIKQKIDVTFLDRVTKKNFVSPSGHVIFCIHSNSDLFVHKLTWYFIGDYTVNDFIYAYNICDAVPAMAG